MKFKQGDKVRLQLDGIVVDAKDGFTNIFISKFSSVYSLSRFYICATGRIFAVHDNMIDEHLTDIS